MKHIRHSRQPSIGPQWKEQKITTCNTLPMNRVTSVLEQALKPVRLLIHPLILFQMMSGIVGVYTLESGSAVGDWSDTWHFQKKWYLQPQLLTPTNGYSKGLYPLYSWTPVPGASRYRIDIDTDAGFTSPIYESKITANTTYSPQTKYDGTQHYYWRVTPIDGGGELGLTSAVAEFQSYYNSTAPILVYPLYYYPPNDPIYYGDEFPMNPVEDRTVAYPIFIWHRVMVPSPTGGVFASAYRIQVDTTHISTISCGNMTPKIPVLPQS